MVPEPLFKRLKSAALVIVDVPRGERALHIRHEYVDVPLAQLSRAGEAAPHRALATQLAASLRRVQRRLGGLRHDLVLADLDQAFAHHARTGETAVHERWIEALLEHYYDPMYAYQLTKRGQTVVFQGDTGAVAEFLTSLLLAN